MASRRLRCQVESGRLETLPTAFALSFRSFHLSTMPRCATLLVDDQDILIQYLCPSLYQNVHGSYYNNSWTTVLSESCDKGWFEYTFYGTGIHLATSVATGSTYSVKIDNGSFVSHTGSGAYDSPALTDGKHTITYAADDAKSTPVFDYLTVTAGQSTHLEGQTLIVDDSDSSISFAGSWSNSPSTSLSFDYSTSLYMNTTHWSSKTGDSLQFQFEGTSISLFGIVTNMSGGGNITASYTLDGVSTSLAIPPGTLQSLPMVKLFHADVKPGIHNLAVDITNIQGSPSLGIDFITYNASFDSVSGDDAIGSLNNNSLNLGSKVGIAVGVLMFFMILASLLIFAGRRYLRNKNPKFKLPDSLESQSFSTKQPKW
jgi:hypothetical protein